MAVQSNIKIILEVRDKIKLELPTNGIENCKKK